MSQIMGLLGPAPQRVPQNRRNLKLFLLACIYGTLVLRNPCGGQSPCFPATATHCSSDTDCSGGLGLQRKLLVGIWSALILRVSWRLRVQTNSYSVHVPKPETKLSIGARGHAVRASRTETIFLKAEVLPICSEILQSSFYNDLKESPKS